MLWFMLQKHLTFPQPIQKVRRLTLTDLLQCKSSTKMQESTRRKNRDK